MIKYDLKCAEGHVFDAWFRSSAAFDEQCAGKLVRCAVCGDARVEKAIMAPRLGSGHDAEATTPMLSAPKTPAEAALAKLRTMVEQTSDYVGSDFADEARRIHEGEAEGRSIWGEAKPEDASALHDDGIPVAPIPWMRKRDD